MGYAANVVMVDGTELLLDIDLGFGITIRKKLPMYGIRPVEGRHVALAAGRIVDLVVRGPVTDPQAVVFLYVAGVWVNLNVSSVGLGDAQRGPEHDWDIVLHITKQ